MKSLFLAALAAFTLFTSAPASAQQYRDSYYHESQHDSNSRAAYVVGALIEDGAHRAHERRSNYYGDNRYDRNRHHDRYTYAPRCRSYPDQNYYSIYPGYRSRNYYRGHGGYRGRHHSGRD